MNPLASLRPARGLLQHDLAARRRQSSTSTCAPARYRPRSIRDRGLSRTTSSIRIETFITRSQDYTRPSAPFHAGFPGPRLDVSAVLAFAEHALTNATRFWELASPKHKLAIQRFFFPEGLVWEASGNFKTPATSSAFAELRALASPETRLASLSIENSNRLAGWLREMDMLREAVGRVA